MFKLSFLITFFLLAFVNGFPAPGTYSLVNRILDGQGRTLAITFNGANAPVILQPFSSSNKNQMFNLQFFDPNNPIGMTVTPIALPSQQLAPIFNSVSQPVIGSAGPAGATFNITTTTADGSIISDDGPPPFPQEWFPTTAAGGAQISWASISAPGDIRQFWVITPVLTA